VACCIIVCQGAQQNTCPNHWHIGTITDDNTTAYREVEIVTDDYNVSFKYLKEKKKERKKKEKIKINVNCVIMCKISPGIQHRM
jgi:ornithine carbamoyltransferase